MGVFSDGYERREIGQMSFTREIGSVAGCVASQQRHGAHGGMGRCRNLARASSSGRCSSCTKGSTCPRETRLPRGEAGAGKNWGERPVFKTRSMRTKFH